MQSKTRSQIVEIKVVDGTIENSLVAPSLSGGVAKISIWCSVVIRDRSKPGGLERNFLNRVGGQKRLFLVSDLVVVGAYIELAAKTTTHKGTSSTNQSIYKIEEILDDRLLCSEVSVEEVPAENDPANRLDSPSSASARLIDQLKAELAVAKNVVFETQKRRAEAKNTVNRMSRKFKSLPEDVLVHLSRFEEGLGLLRQQLSDVEATLTDTAPLME